MDIDGKRESVWLKVTMIISNKVNTKRARANEIAIKLERMTAEKTHTHTEQFDIEMYDDDDGKQWIDEIFGILKWIGLVYAMYGSSMAFLLAVMYGVCVWVCVCVYFSSGVTKT